VRVRRGIYHCIVTRSFFLLNLWILRSQLAEGNIPFVFPLSLTSLCSTIQPDQGHLEDDVQKNTQLLKQTMNLQLSPDFTLVSLIVTSCSFFASLAPIHGGRVKSLMHNSIIYCFSKLFSKLLCFRESLWRKSCQERDCKTWLAQNWHFTV